MPARAHSVGDDSSCSEEPLPLPLLEESPSAADAVAAQIAERVPADANTSAEGSGGSGAAGARAVSRSRSGAVERTAVGLSASRRRGGRAAAVPSGAARTAVAVRAAALPTDADKRRCCMEALVLWTLEEASQRTAALLGQAATLRDMSAARILAAAATAGKIAAPLASASAKQSAAAGCSRVAASLGVMPSAVAIAAAAAHQVTGLMFAVSAVSAGVDAAARQRARGRVRSMFVCGTLQDTGAAAPQSLRRGRACISRTVCQVSSRIDALPDKEQQHARPDLVWTACMSARSSPQAKQQRVKRSMLQSIARRCGRGCLLSSAIKQAASGSAASSNQRCDCSSDVWSALAS